MKSEITCRNVDLVKNSNSRNMLTLVVQCAHQKHKMKWSFVVFSFGSTWFVVFGSWSCRLLGLNWFGFFYEVKFSVRNNFSLTTFNHPIRSIVVANKYWCRFFFLFRNTFPSSGNAFENIYLVLMLAAIIKLFAFKQFVVLSGQKNHAIPGVNLLQTL